MASRLLLACGLALALAQASANSIMGIDLGTSTFKTGLVKRGSPLSIVTNLHSKRKTEQMVLFDQGSRFFGADASSLQARKPLACPSMLSALLGRGAEHPSVQDLRSKAYPVPFAFNGTSRGLSVSLDPTPGRAGSKIGDYTPEELTAMVLSHARDITREFTSDGKAVKDPLPKDAVLTVPAFATHHERSSLLVAADLAGLNVLALVEETTAAALHYGMDKVVPAGEEETVLFYNLGATSLQVAVARYFSYEVREGGKNRTVGSFEVVGKAWDATLGGSAFDDAIVGRLADEFNEQWRKKDKEAKDKDVRDFPRAMVKLRVQATKTKEVLSANTNTPIFIENLHADVDFKSSLSREEFERLSEPLFARAAVPVAKALEVAGLGISDVTAIELIGGGMRVPKVQSTLALAVGDLELGLHINSDESMALGAAFHGANISTAFRVRKVGMTDMTLFPVGVRLSDMEEEGGGGGLLGGLFKKKDGKKEDGEEEEEEWSKQATIFKAKGKMGVKK
ncbi:hypothetical protein TeGR_g261, partial [Tetraparma gracilis]